MACCVKATSTGSGDSNAGDLGLIFGGMFGPGPRDPYEQDDGLNIDPEDAEGPEE